MTNKEKGDTPNLPESVVTLLPELPLPWAMYYGTIEDEHGKVTALVDVRGDAGGLKHDLYTADQLRTYRAEGLDRHSKILLLASEMLDQYSDRLGNDGCNDWDWPESWTSEDRSLFLAKFHKHNRSQPQDIEDWGNSLGNASVAYTLSKELKDAAQAVRSEASEGDNDGR